MVDKSIVKEINENINAGASEGKPDDLLKTFELIKQISEEVNYLKEDVEESEISCQINLSDVNKDYWITINKGTVEYNEGKIENPAITITTSKEVGLGMFFGEVDANILAPLGKIRIAGNYKILRAFQEIYEDSIEEFKKRY